MSNLPTYSFEQVLDSIHEMRRSLRSSQQNNSDWDWDPHRPFWEEAGDTTDAWFEDCEFDPRFSDDV